jgi:hypothetical protein
MLLNLAYMERKIKNHSCPYCKKLSLCLPNHTLRHEDVWGSGCRDPHFLELGTSWKSVVRFTPRGKSPRYSLDRRLDEARSRYGRHGEVKILAPTGTETPTPWSSSPLPVAITTALSRLWWPYCKVSNLQICQKPAAFVTM